MQNRYLYKSFDDAILQAGGVKIFEGTLDGERLKKYNSLWTCAGSDGSFIPSGDCSIVTYVIRRAEGDIYIALEKRDFETSSIQIVQVKPFEQTITKIMASDIVADLTSKGESILYINFDVDKATLTADGLALSKQIGLALKAEPALKIRIEGHTDNTGDEKHNKKLSEERAKSVMQSLIEQGIEKSRLMAVGFGADKPFVSNDTDAKKSQNRRVELIRTN